MAAEQQASTEQMIKLPIKARRRQTPPRRVFSN